MGSFVVPVGAVATTGSWTTTGGTDVDVLNGGVGDMTQTSIVQVVCPPDPPQVVLPGPGTYSLDCTPATTIILDGTTPVGFDDLPQGFTVVGLEIFVTRLVYISGFGAGGHDCVSAFTMTYGSEEIFNNDPELSDGDHDNFLAGITSLPSNADLFANHWSCQQTFIAANTAVTSCGSWPYSAAGVIYQSFYLIGTYAITNKLVSVTFGNG